MMTTTDEPTRAIDRYDWQRLSAETQATIMRRVLSLYDGTRTRSLCWRTAMAEYRLTQPRSHADGRFPDAFCTCGWTAVSNSKRGLRCSVNAHNRFHAKQRRDDQELAEGAVSQ